MDHSLNEQINTLQSNLSSLQHDKQTSEEQLQEQIGCNNAVKTVKYPKQRYHQKWFFSDVLNAELSLTNYLVTFHWRWE